MPNPLTRADVEHVARLARLALSEAEIEHFTGQLDAILEHAAQVAALDTADVPPTVAPASRWSTCCGPTSRVPCLDRDDVLAMAPAAEDGRFRVPRILGEDA